MKKIILIILLSISVVIARKARKRNSGSGEGSGNMVMMSKAEGSFNFAYACKNQLNNCRIARKLNEEDKKKLPENLEQYLATQKPSNGPGMKPELVRFEDKTGGVDICVIVTANFSAQGDKFRLLKRKSKRGGNNPNCFENYPNGK